MNFNSFVENDEIVFPALFNFRGLFSLQKAQKATKKEGCCMSRLTLELDIFLPWIFFEQTYYPALLASFADLYGLENWQSDT